ncbi:MAG: hypothetical protein GZ087_06015 [Flavobacterium sp.]|nr:hypothetical protein [Flavobacterium sp.]
MKRILFFIFIIGMGSNAFGQVEFNSKFKGIKPKTSTVKPKKEVPPSTNLPKLNLPKIVAPNIFRETNIFGTKPIVNNSFDIGTAENHFSMTPKNEFEHKLGDVYQEKMANDLHKTLHEGEGKLDRTDRDLGEFKTKSNYLEVKYRDYIQVDGDLINVYLNENVIETRLYLNGNLNQFNIPLVIGLNKIEFVVASQGTSGGNTAEIHVIDEAGKAVTDEYWDNLALGTKIKLIVIRE